MPNISDKVQGAITTDEWGIDPQRLCAANAKSAEEHGAAVRTHCQVTEFFKDPAGNILGVKRQNRDEPVPGGDPLPAGHARHRAVADADRRPGRRPGENPAGQGRAHDL